MDGFLGEIRLWGSSRIPPENWKACKGDTLAINDYPDLHAIIGVIYGGDDRTTFMLPNLQGRMVVGAGNGPGIRPTPLASMGGEDQIWVGEDHMPSHTHNAVINNGSAISERQQSLNDEGTENSPAGNYPAMSNANNYNSVISQHTFLQPSSGSFAANPVYSGNAGGSVGTITYAPYQVIHYIICVRGVFPVRN